MVLSVLAAVAANPLLISRSGEGQLPREVAFSATPEQVSLAPAA